MVKINRIVVHCTDSQDSLDIGFREINDWHRQNGWLSESGISCGYHYIIRRSGTIERGRPDLERGAHVKGYNTGSIGIVWVGRDNIDKRQYQTLLALINAIRYTYGVDIDDVFGHTELDPKKTCPNLDMNRLRAELLFNKGEVDVPK